MSTHAISILAKGMIGEKTTIEKPEELPIRDYDRGVEQMLGTVEEQLKKEEALKRFRGWVGTKLGTASKIRFRRAMENC